MQNLIDSVIRELEQKNYFEAIKYCNQLIAQFPKNYVFYEIRGNCYLETGSYVAAIQNYTDSIEYFILAEGKSNREVASLYNRRGYARLKLNLYNEAINDFQKAVEYKQDFAEAYNNCGNAYRKLEKYDEALSQCDKAIEFKPDFAEAYNNRGNIYYLFSKDVEAIFDYTKAIELRPNYTGAYYNRGAAYYYLQNKLIEAKSDWEKVISLNPSYERELKGKLEKIDAALDLMRQEGEIPMVSEPLSLVQDEKTEEFEDVIKDEVIEEKQEEETHTEEITQEPVLEIYDKSVPEIHEEEIIKEPVTEKTEETEIVKSEEPVEEKVEEQVEEKPTEEKSEEKVEEKIEEPVIEQPVPEITIPAQGTDIDIPEIDFKSMFQDSEKDIDREDELKPLNEIFELIYEPKIEKESIIPDEVKQLHNEIEGTQSIPEITEEKKDEQIEEENIIQAEEEKPAEVELPVEPHPKEKIPPTYRPEEIKYATENGERSLFKSPIFIIPLVFIVLLIVTVSSYLIYSKIYTKKNVSSKQENTVAQKDTSKLSGNIDSSQIKDTTSIKTEKTEATEESKPVEKKEEKVEKTTPEVTSIKNFVVFKEKDGIYLQIASLKDKNSADTKAASINKKNIKTQVVEADLGEKGKYYRVRIGPFANIEEAKTAANKVE